MKYLLFAILIATTPLSAISLEDQVGQVFISFVYEDDLDSFLTETRLGNVIYFNWANGLNSPAQVEKLSKRVRDAIMKNVGIPPLITIDQEGGRVTRLKEGFTGSPGNRALQTPEEAYRIGKIMAEEMRAVGINCNLAPVVDVDSNPNNPVIGSRSFGSDPDHVIKMGKEMIRGFHDGGVVSVLKHFPGHGDTGIDSHVGLPTVDKTRNELEAVELKPFKALLKDTDAIMTAHIMVPALDPDHCASHSSKILTDLLRNEWGYEGVIISDSLVMKGVAPNQSSFEDAVESVSQAAVKAFQAGCDCLIIGRLEWADFEITRKQDSELVRRVMQNFKQAVMKGEITQERLDESTQRIARLKHLS